MIIIHGTITDDELSSGSNLEYFWIGYGCDNLRGVKVELTHPGSVDDALLAVWGIDANLSQWMEDTGTNYEVMYFVPVSPGGTHDYFPVGIQASAAGAFTITVSVPENVCDTDNGYGNGWADASSVPYLHPEDMGTLNTGSTLTYSDDLVDCETFPYDTYYVDRKDFDLISFTSNITGTVYFSLTTTGGWNANVDILYYNTASSAWDWLGYIEGSSFTTSFSATAGEKYIFGVYAWSGGCPSQTPPLGYHLSVYPQ